MDPRPVVVVVGSVNVDLVTTVQHLPAPGETVIGGRFATHGGGKGANQAVAAARLGARAILVGAVGRDPEGIRERNALSGEGVDVGLLSAVGAPTGRALIVVDGAGQNLIAVAPGANGSVDRRLVRHAFLELAPRSAVVLASLEVPLDAVVAAASMARDRRWNFVLNPAPAQPLPPALVGLCDVITPNETEARHLGGPSALLSGGAGAVVVTLGSEGAELHRPGLPVVRQPAIKAEAVDSTGAGDAFSGTLAWALASGWSIERAVDAAVVAGGLATTVAGARGGLATRHELDQALAARRGP